MPSPDYYRPKNAEVQALRFLDTNNTFLNQDVAQWCRGCYTNSGDSRPGWIELPSNGGRIEVRHGDWIVKKRLRSGQPQFCRFTAEDFEANYVRTFLRHDEIPSHVPGYVAYDEHSLLTDEGGALLVGGRRDWERADAPAHTGIAALPRAFSMSPAILLFPTKTEASE